MAALFIGGSNANRLVNAAATLGIVAETITSGGWVISTDAVTAILPQVIGLCESLPENAPVIIYCLDNSSFCCVNAEGQLSAISKQKDDIYHVVGEIVVVHEVTLAAAVTNLKRILLACGNRKVIIITPGPRYLTTPCCCSNDHCTLHEDGSRAGGQPSRFFSPAGAEGDTTARHRRQAPTGGVHLIIRLRLRLRHRAPHPSSVQFQADALQSASLTPASPARLLKGQLTRRRQLRRPRVQVGLPRQPQRPLQQLAGLARFRQHDQFIVICLFISRLFVFIFVNCTVKKISRNVFEPLLAGDVWWLVVNKRRRRKHLPGIRLTANCFHVFNASIL
jgi:hypothetical protein